MEEEMILVFLGYLLIATLITLVLEAPVIWFCLGRYAENTKKLMGNFILINGITNLTLNTAIFMLGLLYVDWIEQFVIIAELVIPIIEAGMFYFTTKEFSLKKLIVICYIANAISFLLGSWLISIVG